MRAITLTVAMLLTVATLTEAASFTITTTAEQDAALVALQAKLNATRATPLTAIEFRDYLVAQWLDSLVGQAREQMRTSVRDAYQNANQSTRDQVKTLLGIP